MLATTFEAFTFPGANTLPKTFITCDAVTDAWTPVSAEPIPIKKLAAMFPRTFTCPPIIAFPSTLKMELADTFDALTFAGEDTLPRMFIT
ncbi:hypothetical protein MT325_m074L [Paramecium bursaria chlorella virus MT325]|uniref:Uncharacterized protein m074L n=1 Tax=Paramecium bursaria Chlorella virus MT325 TaxID=346932 RepID=A7ITF4_PBCVM|nr:hypothetical protein MT325_m074L [Paramecium bursaria chlorella virus MT325]